MKAVTSWTAFGLFPLKHCCIRLMQHRCRFCYQHEWHQIHFLGKLSVLRLSSNICLGQRSCFSDGLSGLIFLFSPPPPNLSLTNIQQGNSMQAPVSELDDITAPLLCLRNNCMIRIPAFASNCCMAGGRQMCCTMCTIWSCAMNGPDKVQFPEVA